MSDLGVEIRETLNRNCAENASNTPDYILAEYLLECLNAFDKAVKTRDSWYGFYPGPGRRAVNGDGDVR
jgi:hypothetical protein